MKFPTRFASRLAVMLICAAAIVIHAAAALAQFDHLTCFKMKDPQKLAATATLDALRNQFDPAGACRISGKGALYCVPTQAAISDLTVHKQPATPRDIDGGEASGDRICYRAKCPKTEIGDEVVSDPFGTRTASRFKVSLLCAPAVLGALPDLCTDNAACDSAYYCKKPDGNCAGQGTCEAMPGDCPGSSDPKCGCDGQTYSNACLAATAGTSIASDGLCP